MVSGPTSLSHTLVVVAAVRLLRALVSSSFILRSDRVGSRTDADTPSKHAHQHQELRPTQPNQPDPTELDSAELDSTGLDRTELNSTQLPARSGTHMCTIPFLLQGLFSICT